MSTESEFPITMDEAEAQGWRWLSASCATCRHKTLLPFKLLRQQTRVRELSALRIRLYCQRCGFPPESVALTRMVTAGGKHAPTHEDWPLPTRIEGRWIRDRGPVR